MVSPEISNSDNYSANSHRLGREATVFSMNKLKFLRISIRRKIL